MRDVLFDTRLVNCSRKADGTEVCIVFLPPHQRRAEGIRKTAVLLAAMVLAVALASGAALAQSASPEYPYYEFAGKWPVSSPMAIAVDSQDNIYVLNLFGTVQKFTSDGTL